MSKKPSDATISTADIETIHQRIAKNGIDAVLNGVAVRESAQAAYVLCSAFQISETMRVSGSPAALVKWAQNEITARMLVAIEAQYLAHQALWRDFLPEPDTLKSRPTSKGDQNGSGK